MYANATEAFIDNVQDIITMANELVEQAENYFDRDPDSIDWGDHGDVNAVRRALYEAMVRAGLREDCENPFA